jgi:hypothetical protein
MTAKWTLDLKTAYVCTAAERTSGFTPGEGALAYETDTGSWWIYSTESQWEPFSGLSSARPTTFAASLDDEIPGIILAGGDYDGGDVLSNDTNGYPWIIPFRGSGTIVSARAICSAPIETTLRVHFFSESPSTLSNDGEALALDSGDLSIYQGYVDIVMEAVGGFGFGLISQNLPVTAGANLYAIIQTMDPITNEEAGMTLSLSVMIQ